MRLDTQEMGVTGFGLHTWRVYTFIATSFILLCLIIGANTIIASDT